MVVVSLEKTENGRWEDVKSIKTWKRLDDQNLTGIDGQVLWSKSFEFTQEKSWRPIIIYNT